MADSFKLFTDQKTPFECTIELEGADYSETIARLVVEASDRTLLFTGTVNDAGLCEFSISKLRGILNENERGTMALEIIAEDTYFRPWESSFVVTPSKKLTVEVNNNISNKPRLNVDVPRPKAVIKNDPVRTVIKEISEVLTKKGITAANSLKKRTEIKKIIEEHIDKHNLSVSASSLVPEIINSIPKQ